MADQKNFWTDKKLDKIRELASKGYSIKEIAKEFKKSSGSVQRVMSRHGIKVKKTSSFESEDNFEDKGNISVDKKNKEIIRERILELSKEVSLDPGEMIEWAKKKKDYIITGMDNSPLSAEMIEGYESAIEVLQKQAKEFQEKEGLIEKFFMEKIEELDPSKKEEIKEEFEEYLGKLDAGKTSWVVIARDNRGFIGPIISVISPDPEEDRKRKEEIEKDLAEDRNKEEN